MVLLHGFPFDGRMWLPTARALAALGHPVLVPDLRGFGRSPLVPGSAQALPVSTMQDMAADVAAALEGRSQKAIVVGFSMGGYVALQLAARHRELLRGLVLVDTQAGEDQASARAQRLALAERVRTGGAQVLADAMLPNLTSSHSKASAPEVEAELRRLILEQREPGLGAAMRGMAERPDMRGKLAGMNIACLVVCGEEDAITPIDASVRMAQAFRGSHFEAIPKAGHASPLEQPALFQHALSGWLHDHA